MAAAGVIVGTLAFGALGLLFAGVLRAEVNLAALNGLFLVMLLLGGMVIPLSELPTALRRVRAGTALGGAGRGAARRRSPGAGDWPALVVVGARRMGVLHARSWRPPVQVGVVDAVTRRRLTWRGVFGRAALERLLHVVERQARTCSRSRAVRLVGSSQVASPSACRSRSAGRR
jgi:hypothetical protein